MAVVEARDRVGGRIWTERLSDGTPVDRGGAWFAPKHEASFRLAGEVGVRTYKTYVKGAHLLVDGDRVRRYTGLIPKISPMAVVSIARAQMKLDRLSRQLPIDAPWTARRAAEWDAMSVADYLDRIGIRSEIGHDLFAMAVRGLFTGDLREVSFLNMLFLIRAHGSINTLFSIEKGSQENLVEGGLGSIAERVADDLGDVVHLGAPVRRITSRVAEVVVEADNVSVTAGHVVIAVPPALILGIEFDPVLPDERMQLYREAVAGPESKTLIVYDQPFWRAAGFSGQTSEPGSVSEVTIDASPVSGTPGVLASFCFGPVAEEADALDPAERRERLLGALARRLGPEAASPREIIETPWWQEEWTKGCSMAHFPPGTLTQRGHLLRQPERWMHWAGTETATTSYGAVDGAIRSGERAAAEIIG